MKTKTLFTGIAFSAVLSLPVFGQATWTGVGTSGTPAQWSVGSNWSANAPSSSQTIALLFNNTGGNSWSNNDLTGLTVSSISIPGTFGGLNVRDNTITGNAITLDGGVSVATGNWQNIGLNAALTAGAKSFNITSGQLTYSGILSSAGGLTKEGGSKLILTQKNTYSGGTIVNGGTLELTTGGSAGAIVGTVTINASGTISSTTGDTFGYNNGTKVNTLNIVGGTLTHNSGSNLTLSSAVINMTGGTLQSTSTGGLDIYDNGSANTAFNTLASASSATIAGKLNLRQGDNDATGTVFTVADGGASDDLIVSAAIANGSAQGAASAIQKSGLGRMVLSGNNSYSGITTVNAGTLVLRSNTALGGAAGKTVVANNATVYLSNNITVTGETIELTGNGGSGTTGVFRNDSGNNTWAGNITAMANDIRLLAASGQLTISGVISSNSTSYTQLTLRGDGGDICPFRGKQLFGRYQNLWILHHNSSKARCWKQSTAYWDHASHGRGRRLWKPRLEWMESGSRRG